MPLSSESALRAFDLKLRDLFHFADADVDLERLQLDARRFCDEYTEARNAEGIVGGQDDKLLMWHWEDDCRNGSGIAWGHFSYPADNRVRDLQLDAMNAVVRFVVNGDRPYTRKELFGEAQRAARVYLESRGIEVSECMEENGDPTRPRRPKQSTERGEGRAKLIAALTKHHKYADGGCLNMEPIGNNELARLAGVSESTASAFFKKQFGGHAKYRAKCRDAGTLADALKAVRGEFTPAELSQMTLDAFEVGKRLADED